MNSGESQYSRVFDYLCLYIALVYGFLRQVSLKETYVAAFRFGREQRVRLRYLYC